MKAKFPFAAIFLLLVFSLPACSHPFLQPETTEESAAKETYIETTTEETHSPFYIDGITAENIITYFNEVCLDAEYADSGDASLVQKWVAPIYYMVHGDPTGEDRLALTKCIDQLNTIEGFPGIYEANESNNANLQLYFCSQKELIKKMGDNHKDSEGAVTFWYTDDEIYNATICYRTDLSQDLRNSVILEELYNGLGPIQDTQLRADSIIYADGSCLSLTDVDLLILRLLYHPMVKCGMNAEECENVIRQLYY